MKNTVFTKHILKNYRPTKENKKELEKYLIWIGEPTTKEIKIAKFNALNALEKLDTLCVVSELFDKAFPQEYRRRYNIRKRLKKTIRTIKAINL